MEVRCRGLLLISLAACNQVLGIHATGLAHDAAIDAPAGCHRITAPIVSDTFLSQANPTTAYGTADAMIVTDSDPALLKFYLGGMIQSGERILDAKLSLAAYPNNYQPHVCASPTQPFGCYYCMTGYASWQLYWMTSDWTELDATWDSAKASTPWSAPGASGPSDRSDRVASGPAATGTIGMEATEVDTQMVDPTPYVGDTLSLELLVTQGQATFGVHEKGGCGPAQPASLDLMVCH